MGRNPAGAGLYYRFHGTLRTAVEWDHPIYKNRLTWYTGDYGAVQPDL